MEVARLGSRASRDSGGSGKHLYELAEVHAVDTVDAGRVRGWQRGGLLVDAAIAPGLVRMGGLADGVEGTVEGGRGLAVAQGARGRVVCR